MNKPLGVDEMAVDQYHSPFSFDICLPGTKGKANQLEEPIVEESLESAILGTWENVSLTVTISTVNNTDSTKTGYIPRKEWEARLKIKPILTTYSEDGTYASEYRDLNDSLINKNQGLWTVSGDSLALTSDDITTMYRVECKNDTAIFTGYLDWDSEGNFDDLYEGVQRKL
ncbi:MAG: hypothetical protein ACR2MX_02175 [Cyclobacteriaceae bacterium]